MAIYDVAAAIDAYKADPAGSLQRGLSSGNAIFEMLRKRKQDAEDEKLRTGLSQFYRLAQPARTETDVQGPDIGAMVGQGASMGQMGGQGMMANAGKYLPRSDYLGQLATVMPQMQKREIPAVAGGMDYQGAADYLASNGRLEQAGQMSKLMELSKPQRAKYYGGDGQEVIGADGQRKLIAMTEAGPVELPYQPVSKPKYKFMDDGTVVDETTVSVVGKIPVGLSPAQRMQGLIAQGNQNKPQAVTGADGQIYWVAPGQQLPAGVKAASASGSAAQPSEDERKAAGWVSQAQKAFDDMTAASRLDPSAAKPGVIESLPIIPQALKNSSMSSARQRFNQGASSFSEAALRAATGAGVNEQEAKQKIVELTPQWGDKEEVIRQKQASMQMYLDSLKLRAGRALPAGQSPARAPAPAGPGKPLAPGQKPSLNDIFGGL